MPLSKDTVLVHSKNDGRFLGSSGGISGILVYLEFQRHIVVLYVHKIIGNSPSKGGD